jgi:hypothetical protein
MDTKALQLASRFALPPNSLGYCGKGTAPAKFIECAINGNCDGVEEELEKFIVLNPYLKTLRQISKNPIFNIQDVEAYWLGNDILNKAKKEDYLVLLKYFHKQGVPDFFVEELRAKLPEKFIPFHLFQVLHVGVGKASGAVPFNLESINNCAIRAGKVLEIDARWLMLDVRYLKIEKNRYGLDNRREKFEYRKDLVKGLRIGDTVAVHWRQVVKKLTLREQKNLEFWTKEALKSVRT